MPGSDTVRTGGREIASRSYNFWSDFFWEAESTITSAVLRLSIRNNILPILPSIRSSHWFWDTEILVRSQLHGVRIREFPVRWRAGKGTTVKVKDVFENGFIDPEVVVADSCIGKLVQSSFRPLLRSVLSPLCSTGVWDDLLIALQNSIPAYLVVGTIICFCAWWLRGWRYHIILKNLSYLVGVTASTACIFVSQTVNLIVPARLGDLSVFLILKHEYNVTYFEGVSSLVVERILTSSRWHSLVQ